MITRIPKNPENLLESKKRTESILFTVSLVCFFPVFLYVCVCVSSGWR